VSKDLEAIGGRAVILYDGLCGFCDKTVQWVIRHDLQDKFRFAPQQSAFAEAVLARHGIDGQALLQDNSVYLVLNPGSPHERLLRESDVSVNILSILGGAWAVWGWLMRMVPPLLRNAGYTFVARNRFRIAGRFDSCPVPSPTQRAKFLT
jgi:predicted DCC family thiol-disulfide oxidoreductase YuxK